MTRPLASRELCRNLVSGCVGASVDEIAEFYVNRKRAMISYATALDRLIPASKTLLDEEARGAIWSWARRETAPWQFRGLNETIVGAELENLNNTDERAYIFDISLGNVSFWPKPDHLKEKERFQYTFRADLYKAFLQDVVDLWVPDIEVRFCMSMCDGWINNNVLPTFTYQKPGGQCICLPDPDCLSENFYEAAKYRDPASFLDKRCSAVFYGSTSGALIDEEMARARSLPRLHAAEYFSAWTNVEFMLPNICQYENEGVLQILKGLPFCGGSGATWRQQLEHKFLISIDGNGATCSRVAVALHSNSILMKYDSIYRLYYFDGLQPWRHYLPIPNHEYVLHAIDAEKKHPGSMMRIAEEGRKFAKTYLNREATEIYTAATLLLYKECFIG